MGFALWAVIGLFLDGWAHSEKKPDSFFTPWHGVLYSGFSLAAGWALLSIWRRREQGRSLLETAPAGQVITLLGFGLFGAGAVGDLIWHSLLGIEVSVEALLSPTHLLLLTGGLIALSAPLRTAWAFGSDAPSLSSFLPALFSVTLITAIAGFFLVYLSPFEAGDPVSFPSTRTDIHDLSKLTPAVGAQVRERAGLASFLVTTVVLMVPTLLVLRRWRPPFYAFTFLFGAVILLEVALGRFEQLPLVLSGLAAGLTADILSARRVPTPVIGGATPLVLWLVFFLIYASLYDLGWSPELWAGITFMSGLIGVALSLLSSTSPTASSPSLD